MKMMDDDELGLFDEDDDNEGVAVERMVLAVPGKAPSEIHERVGMVWAVSNYLSRYEFAELKHPDCFGARKIMFLDDDEGTGELSFDNAEEFRVMMKRRKPPTEDEAKEWQQEMTAKVHRFASYYASEGWDPERKATVLRKNDNKLKPTFDMN
jgi:hypothetical protein